MHYDAILGAGLCVQRIDDHAAGCDACGGGDAMNDPRYEPTRILAKYPTMRDLIAAVLDELRRFYPQAKVQIELAPGLTVDILEGRFDGTLYETVQENGNGGREVEPTD
jgi:DNA-binding transcriptional LysR family regulator